MAKRRRGSRTARPLPRHRPFEELVAVALDAIPEPFAGALDEVAIVIADEPIAPSSGARTRSARTRRCTACTRACRGPNGVPTGRRSRTGSRSSGCRSRRTSPIPDDLADEVWITVIHELAHHLGIDDARLHELGID